MGHAPQLSPDITMLYQVGLFLISFLVLKTLVFKPYLELLKLRHERTIGAQEKAAADRTRAQELQVQYENHMRDERRKVAQWVDGERRRIGGAEKEIIQGARDAAAQELQGARKKMETDLHEAQRALLPLTVEFSSAIASKLLGHKVKVPGKSVDKFESPEQETVV